MYKFSFHRTEILCGGLLQEIDRNEKVRQVQWLLEQGARPHLRRLQVLLLFIIIEEELCVNC